MHFSEPNALAKQEKHKIILSGSKYIHLPPDFTKARGFILWEAPVDGQYSLLLDAKENASLSIDGEPALQLQNSNDIIQRVETWIPLTKGLHLFRIELDNNSGDGLFSVGISIPPMMRGRYLEGKDVAAPVLGSINTWWVILTFLHGGTFLFGFCTVGIGLFFLLPLTLQNRSISVGITVVVALVPALFVPATMQREPYIGEMVHKELREKNPDFVFIGNSMLWSRIDDKYLENLLGGKKVYSIVNFGGLSAIHYLSFKYLFIPAKIKPKKVFIFFRGNQFIRPKMRTDDLLAQQTVQRLTPAPDPVYEQIVHGRSRTITDTVYDTLLNTFPIAREHESIRGTISTIALDMASGLRLHNEEDQSYQKKTLSLVNKRFSMTSGSLRGDIDTAYEEQETDSTFDEQESMENTYDFYGNVENSFLPHILQLAHDNNITLVFIRVQERPPKNVIPSDPPILRQYMDDLRTYLTAHDAFLYDFTGDPELPLSAYRDGDHIKDQKKYTELFVKRVGDLLR